MTAFPMDALFEALTNNLWRGTLLVAVVAIALRALKRTTAAERYSVWFAVILVITTAPAVQTAVVWLAASESSLSVATTPATLDPLPRATGSDVPVESAWTISPLFAVPQPLLFVWLAVTALLVVRLGRRCSFALALKRDSMEPYPELAKELDEWEYRLESARLARTRVTERMRSPVAIGWVHPAVLLPEGCDQRLGWEDVELLWRHEQAHLSRRDDWTQLVAEGLCAVMWFHPAIYWIRRELNREREMACDEAVLNGGVEASSYARALGRWAEQATMGGLPVGTMGIGESESQIIRRIEMLLSPSRIFRSSETGWTFAAGLTTAVGLLALLTLAGPLVIRAQSADEPQVEPEAAVIVAGPAEANPLVDVVMPPVHPVEPPAVVVSQAAPVPPTPPEPPQPDADHARASAAHAEEIEERVHRLRAEMQLRIDEIHEHAAKVRAYVREYTRPSPQENSG